MISEWNSTKSAPLKMDIIQNCHFRLMSVFLMHSQVYLCETSKTIGGVQNHWTSLSIFRCLRAMPRNPTTNEVESCSVVCRYWLNRTSLTKAYWEVYKFVQAISMLPSVRTQRVTFQMTLNHFSGHTILLNCSEALNSILYMSNLIVY